MNIHINPYSNERAILYISIYNVTQLLYSNYDNTFYFYDNFEINKEESLISGGLSSIEELIVINEQPKSSFIISNDITEISLILNCDEYHLNCNNINMCEFSSFIKINKFICQDIYDNIVNALNSNMVKIDTTIVTFKPINSWLVYNCYKTKYNIQCKEILYSR